MDALSSSSRECNIFLREGDRLTTEPGMQRLAAAGRIYRSGQGGLSYIRYLDDFGVSPINNVWTDVSQGGFTDDKIYVVQTGT